MQYFCTWGGFIESQSLPDWWGQTLLTQHNLRATDGGSICKKRNSSCLICTSLFESPRHSKRGNFTGSLSYTTEGGIQTQIRSFASSDEHLFRQVNTITGCNQLPVFCCTNVHLRRNTPPLFRREVLDDVMSQSELTTISFNSFYQPDLPKQNPRLQDWDSWEPPRLLCPRVEFENFDKNLEASSNECLESERRWRQSELWGRQHGARLPGKIPWKENQFVNLKSDLALLSNESYNL